MAATLGVKRNRQATVRAAAFEALESRRYMDAYFNSIRDKVADPNTGMIHRITVGLQALNSGLERLPLVNKAFGEVGNLTAVTNSIENFRSKLFQALTSLNQGAAEATIESNLTNLLGPLLTSPVNATVTGANVDISFGLGLSATFNSGVGLGLDSVPFRPSSSTSASFQFGVLMPSFKFGIKNGTPYFVSDQPGGTAPIHFTLGCDLPDTISVGLGFLTFTATDAHAGNDLGVKLTADVSTTGGLSAPRLGGAVNPANPNDPTGLDLLLNLEAQVGSGTSDRGLPKLKTDFRMDWDFPTIPLGGATRAGVPFGIPTLSLNNVSIDLGSVLNNLIQPIAERVQVIVQPFQPFLDLVKKRVPGVSDVSEALGGGEVSVMQFSTLLDGLPNPPTAFINAVQTVDKLRQFSATATALAGQGANKWINLGSFPITAQNNQTLFSAMPNQLGNLGQQILKWSDLRSLTAGTNFQGLQTQIKALLGNDIGDDVCALFTQLQDEWQSNGLKNGVVFDLPVVKDPAGTALGMLLGQDKDLVKVRANVEFNFDKRFNFLPDPFIAAITASGDFRAHAEIGYDTRGLAEAIAPVYSGNNFIPERLLNGLWIDRTTGAHANASIGITTGAGVFSLAEFTVSGGINGNANMNLVLRSGFPATEPKVRPWKGDLGASIFSLSGGLNAFAMANAKLGFEVPIINKWVGLKKSWTFAEAPLFAFSTNTVPIPQEILPAPIPETHDLARQSGGILTLAVGPNASWRGGLGGIDETITINRVLRNHFSTDGPIFPHAVIGDLRNLDKLSVSGYGITQTFSGVTKVVADFSGGNDVLQVNDYASFTLYQIVGGSGNDKLTVTGSADVDLTGGIGDDTLEGGQGTVSILLDGGAGTNQLSIGAGRLQDVAAGVVNMANGIATFDNRNDSRPAIYTISPNYTFTPPFSIIGYTLGVETGAQFKQFTWSVGTSVHIVAGAGNDQFFGTAPLVTIHGGAGNDVMNPNDHILEWLTSFNGSMSFIGDQGSDTVIMDNSLGRVPNISLVQDPEGQAIRWTRTGESAQLLVSGLETVQVYSTATTPTILRGWNAADVDVYGGPTTVESEMYTYLDRTIRMHSAGTFTDPNLNLGPDMVGIDGIGPYVTPGIGKRMNVTYDGTAPAAVFGLNKLYVDPAASRAAKRWTASFAGVPSASNQLIVASSAADPLGYSYLFNTSTLNIGTWQLPVTSTTLPLLSMTGGVGNDTFDIRSAIRSSIQGGAGKDSFIVAGANLPATLQWATFDGGPDIDTFTLNDPGSSPSHRVDYGVSASSNTSINRTLYVRDFLDPNWWDPFPSSFNTPAIERMNINGGTRQDTLSVSTQNSTGQVVHLDQRSIGAYTGDTYFGANGGLFFNGINNLNLQLRSNADTVYAQPHPLAAVSIVGGATTTAPGNRLILALAAAQNRAINPGTPGSGTVTSTNLKPLTYSEFDSVTNPDNISPVAVIGRINLDGVSIARAVIRRQAMDVQFSEGIGQVDTTSVELTNRTTGQVIPSSAMEVSFETSTNTAHFTFPELPGGILPDGDYRVRVLAGQSNDLIGNAVAADASFDFFFMSGDANHDRKVDVADLGVLASNWQQTGRTFSQGDFNYDGKVDVADLGILASKWQTSIPMPSMPFAESSGSSRSSGRAIEHVGLIDVI